MRRLEDLFWDAAAGVIGVVLGWAERREEKGRLSHPNVYKGDVPLREPFGARRAADAPVSEGYVFPSVTSRPASGKLVHEGTLERVEDGQEFRPVDKLYGGTE